MLPYWWALSLIRSQVVPVSSDRYTALTPSTVPTRKSAWYDCPGAARPKATLTASVTLEILVKLVPELVDRKRPVLPASQMSPSRPGTALNFTPLAGNPVAAAVNDCPPFVLT